MRKKNFLEYFCFAYVCHGFVEAKIQLLGFTSSGLRHETHRDQLCLRYSFLPLILIDTKLK